MFLQKLCVFSFQQPPCRRFTLYCEYIVAFREEEIWVPLEEGAWVAVGGVSCGQPTELCSE